MKAFVVFDLDGTLVESLPGIAEGLNRALAAVGRTPHPESAVRGMIGRGAANLCAAALGYADAALAPAEELEALHAAFRREYPQCWQGRGTVPYAGMERLLGRLRSTGAGMAVLSNKPHEVTSVMVRRLFPEITFDNVFGQVDDFPRKPDPLALFRLAMDWGVAVSELTLVGDSLIDARTAANAGCNCVLVGWGYAARSELEASGYPIVDSVAELERCLFRD